LLKWPLVAHVANMITSAAAVHLSSAAAVLTSAAAVHLLLPLQT
jgi:hypothetical protein